MKNSAKTLTSFSIALALLAWLPACGGGGGTAATPADDPGGVGGGGVGGGGDGGGGGGGGGGGAGLTSTNPEPADRAVDVGTDPTLRWGAVADAVEYLIFLGEDLANLPQIVQTTELETFTPILETGKTYFWRVDIRVEDESVRTGAVWRFTTAAPLDASILSTSEAGWISIDGGPQMPATAAYFSGLGTADTIVMDFGEYNCTGNWLLEPAFGKIIALIDPDGRPTGEVNVLLNDAPGEWRNVKGIDVLWDGGMSYTAAGTATLEDLPDASFAFDVVIDNPTSTIRIDGNVAHLDGTLGLSTRKQMQYLKDAHPEVDTIEFGCLFGSVDDFETMAAGNIMRDAGYTTIMRADSDAASGGVDLFTAGVRRIVEDGATFRVHAWTAGDGTTADQFQPCPGHPQHASTVEYLNRMLGDPTGADFYCFTISFGEWPLHIMDADEIALYKLATE